MANMLNLFSSTFRSGRDDHGVGELLEAVSRRSSVSDNERQALSEIARRVRTSKPQSPVKKSHESPSTSSHGSSHGSRHGSDYGSSHGGAKPAFKVDLLRGFGPPPPIESGGASESSKIDYKTSSTDLLRGFGPPEPKDESAKIVDVADGGRTL
mmetsp:Transcript_127829/g.190489  ORF Transcript_127829/g.190489 Transcript_127829/m.190489 type:complete len:154 (-) Transcript_127829:120-581(-)|eukprot:CAMPEP_0117005382 /NCGR_PEP_ID=MMETSP0472-20121206/6017_1 /TAXON_ID=693140 ORGANISM="Tiarina fusus, Strain LIS" /NCGR_SAMPLE_ID=MMETSP0472 /ASSEMBLY_ACC=CAM_ASM_000603 /LENGTH=153 /DNA_ID=CAMNT_0004706605 /DNA_START=90 /DNA_END=551 /DNA_ORIENTATION=+